MQRRENVDLHIARKVPKTFRLGLKTDVFLHSVFFNHAVRIARHPWLFLFGSAVVMIALLPWGSEFSLDYGFSTVIVNQEAPIIHQGREFGLRDNVEVLVGSTESTNALSNLEILHNLHQKIFDFKLTERGRGSRFKEMCQPRIPDKNIAIPDRLGSNSNESLNDALARCRFVSILSLWNSSAAFLADDDPIATINRVLNGTNVVRFPGSNDQVALDMLASGIKRDENGNITSVNFWKFTAELKPSILFTNQLNDFRQSFLLNNLVTFIRTWDNTLLKGTNLQVFCADRRIAPTDFGAAGTVWFLALVIYLLITGFRIRSSSKVFVIFVGFISGLLAITGAVTLSLSFNLGFSHLTIYGIMIVIGIVMDDVFVILAAIDTQRGSPEMRFAQGVGEAATSIFMTTFTDIIVFACSLLSGTQALQSFGFFMVASLSLDFLYQNTFVISVLMIDMRREITRNRCGCTKRSFNRSSHLLDDDDSVASLPSNSPEKQYKLDTIKVEPRQTDESKPRSTAQSTSNSVATSVVEITGRSVSDVDSVSTVNDKFSGDGVSYLCKMLVNKYAPLTTTRGFKIFSFALLLGLVGFAAVTCSTLRVTIVNYKDMGTADSDLFAFRSVEKQNFPLTDDLVVLIDPNIQLWKSLNKLMQVCDIMIGIPSEYRIKNAEHRCWSDLFVGNTTFDNKDAFMVFLKQQLEQHPQYRRDILFELGENDIRATKFIVPVNSPTNYDTAKQMESMLNKELVAKSKAVGVSVEASLIEIALANDIDDQTINLFVVAALSVFLVMLACSVLLINPYTAFLVGGSQLLTASSTLGLLDVLELPMDHLVLVVAFISLGLGVDFTAHLIHHFNISKGHVDQRIREAFGGIGGGVVHGFVSSYSLIVVLSVSTGLQTSVISVICTSLLFSFVISFTIIPVLLQVLPLSPTVRDMALEKKLQKRKTPLDVEWEMRFKILKEQGQNK